MSDVTLIPIVIDPAQYLITCLIFTMKNHSTIKIALTIVKLLQNYFVELVFLLQFGKVLSKRIVDCFLLLKGHYNILSAELKIALTQ